MPPKPAAAPDSASAPDGSPCAAAMVVDLATGEVLRHGGQFVARSDLALTAR